MTEFETNTAKLRAQMENGDIAKICDSVGCATNTLVHAWNRKDAMELKPKERKVYEAFVKHVSKKIADKERLNQRLAEATAQLP